MVVWVVELAACVGLLVDFCWVGWVLCFGCLLCDCVFGVIVI